MDVLQLDVSGRPQAWISSREAAVLYASDALAWTLGQAFQVMRGGTQRATGLPSRIELHPIVAVRGAIPSRAWRQQPALTNLMPDEAHLTLMYLPYVPSLHEDMILRGRRIVADQMDFLLASVPRSSRLHG